MVQGTCQHGTAYTRLSLTPSAAEARALKQSIREAKWDSLGECKIYTALASGRASRQSSWCAGELPPSTLPSWRCLSSLDGPLEKTKDDFSRNSNNIDSVRKRWRGCIAPSKSSFLLSCTEQGAQKAEKERQKKKSLTTNHTYTTIFCHATQQQQHVTPNSHNSWHSAQRLLVRRMLTLAP